VPTTPVQVLDYKALTRRGDQDGLDLDLDLDVVVNLDDDDVDGDVPR